MHLLKTIIFFCLIGLSFNSFASAICDEWMGKGLKEIKKGSTLAYYNNKGKIINKRFSKDGYHVVVTGKSTLLSGDKTACFATISDPRGRAEQTVTLLMHKYTRAALKDPEFKSTVVTLGELNGKNEKQGILKSPTDCIPIPAPRPNRDEIEYLAEGEQGIPIPADREIEDLTEGEQGIPTPADRPAEESTTENTYDLIDDPNSDGLKECQALNNDDYSASDLSECTNAIRTAILPESLAIPEKAFAKYYNTKRFKFSKHLTEKEQEEVIAFQTALYKNLYSKLNKKEQELAGLVFTSHGEARSGNHAERVMVMKVMSNRARYGREEEKGGPYPDAAPLDSALQSWQFSMYNKGDHNWISALFSGQ
jgi:hypothetical protein